MRFGKKSIIVSAAVMAIGTATFASAKVPETAPAGAGTDKPAPVTAGIDMSSLNLPDGFIPFDETHVPDGKNAPANGELKPIEFDSEGKMLNGQKPTDEQQPGMKDGQRPELPEGVEAPKEGELPEKPADDSQKPEMKEGRAPEKPADDKQPQNNGRTPEDGGQPPR